MKKNTLQNGRVVPVGGMSPAYKEQHLQVYAPLAMHMEAFSLACWRAPPVFVWLERIYDAGSGRSGVGCWVSASLGRAWAVGCCSYWISIFFSLSFLILLIMQRVVPDPALFFTCLGDKGCVLDGLFVSMGKQCENGPRKRAVGLQWAFLVRMCYLLRCMQAFVYIGRCGPVSSWLEFILSLSLSTLVPNNPALQLSQNPSTAKSQNQPNTMHLSFATLAFLFTLLLPILASHDDPYPTFSRTHHKPHFPTGTGTAPATCPTKTITTTTTVTVTTTATGTGGFYPTATGTGASSGTGVYYPTAGLRYVKPRKQRREGFRWF